MMALRSLESIMMIEQPRIAAGTEMRIWSQVALFRPPMSQKTTPDSLSPAKYCKADTRALNRAPMAIPASSNVSTGTYPRRSRDTAYTRNSVMKAKRKAMAGMANAPLTQDTPRTRARDAPNAAPADMPMTEGEAMGFLNRPCMVAPATARDAPTMTPSSTRGRRRLRTICLSLSLPPPSSMDITWSKGMLTTPMLRQMMMAATSARDRITMIIDHLAYLALWILAMSSAAIRTSMFLIH
ncbi:MAG: hypothetical protein A4E31_00404 [Methanomassiliicoccales archaeon PtaU1.Bin030]|nr:MAG: hypothetical protein A4E31_00404 [Methanomassiliicoccales archaeon PtaU1.Bin030]